MVAKAEARQQRVIVLGSGPALSSATRDNTFFVFDSDAGSLLIDCGGSPFHKLLRIGLDPSRLSGVVLTHAHPDHVYGLASLVHEMWLDGRTEALDIYANSHAERVALSLLDVFELRSKPLPLDFHLIPEEPGYLLTQNAGFEVRTAPVRHQVPTVAVRIDSLSNGRAVAFSSDTSPCPELVALAKGADLLFHECAVEEPDPFHSTPEDVGQVAAAAEVGRVILVHAHHSLTKEPYSSISQIAKLYPGDVRFAEDFDVYQL